VLEGITKRFGTLTALDEVSLTLRRGTVHALLGENGAGKTTLMRVAYGLIQPDSGRILVGDHPTVFRSPAAAISAGLGMVHQQFSLVPAMTVTENIALGGRGRLALNQLRQRIESLMERTGLELNPEAKVADLGPAERQKLEILRTFAHDARVLILDEPTAVLTEQDTSELFAQIVRYTSAGNSVVLITHKLHDALEHADFVTVLRKGKVVLESRASDETEASLTTAMIGEGFTGNAGKKTASILRESIGVVFGTEIYRGEILGIAALEGAARPFLKALLTIKATRPDLEIGFVPENRVDDGLIGDFSLVENFALSNAASLSGIIDWEGMRERTDTVIKSFDVRTSGVDAQPGKLSGGNQQRFVLGRELIREPDLLVLENPTQGLDLNAAAFVHGRLRDAAARGTAVVFYSSDLDELVAHSDRVVVISSDALAQVPVDRDSIGRALLAE
jgi:simple sugar transport system ATP-binding protein